MKHEFKVMA